MTLKKCTVRQLDDTFWRVDWEGEKNIWRTEEDPLTRSPTLLMRVAKGFAFVKGQGRTYPTIEAMLNPWGLASAEPGSETAEARVRKGLDQPGTFAVRPCDVSAILAELDAVRADSARMTEAARLADLDWRNATAEVERLRAQRPVDIEAVLAPVRRVLSAYRTAPVYGMKYELLARHVVDDLGQAIAEAEKIARGQ